MDPEILSILGYPGQSQVVPPGMESHGSTRLQCLASISGISSSIMDSIIILENIFNEYFTSKSILENRILYNCVEVSGVVKAGPDRARA